MRHARSSEWGDEMAVDRQHPERSSTHATSRRARRARLLVAWLTAVPCLLSSLSMRAAEAQSFGPPVRSEVILQFFDSQKNVRFTLAAYYTSWENPFRATITTVSPALGFQRVSRK